MFVIDSRKDARAASAARSWFTRRMKRAWLASSRRRLRRCRTAPEIAKLPSPLSQAPLRPTNIPSPGIDANVPIGCGDAPVVPGDVIVGDGEGVVVIPAHLADEIADEAVEMTAFEDVVGGR